MAACYLKGVAPEWELGDIYNGMSQFMILQRLGLLIRRFFPAGARRLSQVICGS
jgi:TRAP-type mannitol/chloroaromatic compound transport system permease large subunit